MTHASPVRVWSVVFGAGALGAGAGATFGRLAVSSWRRATEVAVPDPADGLLVLVCLAGAACCGWLALGAAATAVEGLPGALGALGRRVSERLAPALVRRTVALLAGTAVAAALAPGTAVAATRPAVVEVIPRPAGDDGGGGIALPDPGFHPLATASTPATTPPHSAPTAPEASEPGFRPVPPRTGRPAVPIDSLTSPTRPGSVVEEDYVVRRGDTLWDIAARHLGPHATIAQIGAEWPRWYAANRALIGPDPDVIHPGQRLAPPAPVGAR